MTTAEATQSPAPSRTVRGLTQVHGWRFHPGVRSNHDLTLGERAADRMRNGMGSWVFVFAALAFLFAWMALNRGSGFDPYPFILLNLVLSCLAALQGAILLIAAKRSDQIAAELAHHDYETDVQAKQMIEQLSGNFAAMAGRYEALQHEVAALRARLEGS
ncbi:MAG TPA: DUF1003 domain-containing protein [Kineosporiaceae bacterium]